MIEGPAIVDTNVVIRLLRKEDAQHAAAKAIVAEAVDKGRPLVLMDIVLAETVFVLGSIYGRPRAEITEILAEILDHPGIASTRPEILLEALVLYRATKLHFVDCYLAAVAKASGRRIATFDKELGKMAGEEQGRIGPQRKAIKGQERQGGGN